ncbi:hypothetical protein V2J09_004996 [Rumex salicifolius]
MPPSSSSPRISPSMDDDGTITLIPGLPNHLSALILAYVPIPHTHRLQSTSRSWRFLLSSKTLIPLRLSSLPPHRISHLLCIFPQDPSLSSPYLFDPQSLAWRPLPPMPINPHVYGLCNFTSISVGRHVYVIGGSLFDTRSFPIDRPSPSSAVFRFDLAGFRWDHLSPMLSPRGSFACAAIGAGSGFSDGQILVAGGGSRHTMFGAGGSRMSSVEKYDIREDRWVALDAMPRFRAGCVGFVAGKGKEFWVMGGYGESRTVSGVFPVDEYHRDAVVMECSRGGGGRRWREVGEMWEEGERRQLGKIVSVDNEDGESFPSVFMLDDHAIFRYNKAINHWVKETSIPRQTFENLSYGFVALNGELHVLTLLHGLDSTDIRRSRLHRKGTVLYIQIYHPGNKTWRSLITKPPFYCSLDFRTAVMCTVRV